MKAVRPFTILIFLIVSTVLAGAAGEDVYASIADYLRTFADPNTGLTSFPTLMLPLGGLSEGMGTAYTAVGRDSGYIESNPAASALLANSELAFFHHSWIEDSDLEGVVYTVRFNDLGFGVGGKFLYVPFNAYNEWGLAGARDYISETVGTLNISYNFFSSYSFYGVAAGANLKVAYRNTPPVFALNQSALAVMGDFGLLTSFNLLKFYNARAKNFSFGIVVKNLGISTLSDETLPQVATAGLAWSPLRPWTVAVDYSLPFSFPWQPPAPGAYLAVGTTVNVAEFLSVQAGTLISPYNPKVSVGAALNLGTLALTINYNLDLSSQPSPLDKFSVQARLGLGDSGRAAQAKEADDLYYQGIEEFANHNYARAIELWEQVLKIDPKYLPAADFIRTAKETLALQEQAPSTGQK